MDCVIRHTLVIKEIPPSLNVLMREHWSKRSKQLERWRWLVADAWKNMPVIPGRVKVKIIYYFPDKRKRDYDNYSGKLILDSLKGKVITEDNSTVIVELAHKFEYDKADPRVVIEIDKVDTNG
jgi:Holliday junction resolvase RusA-like endonuclease